MWDGWDEGRKEGVIRTERHANPFAESAEASLPQPDGATRPRRRHGTTSSDNIIRWQHCTAHRTAAFDNFPAPRGQGAACFGTAFLQLFLRHRGTVSL